MTEDRLSGLFDEIRKESAQTSISEVDQWIDATVVAGATAGLFATLKLLLIKKPLIMWTTLLTVTGGASLGVVMILSKPEIKEQPVKKENTAYSAPAKTSDDQKKETRVEEPVELETPRLDEPIRESNSENPMPEDLGVPVPVRSPQFDRDMGIPAHRKVQTTESFTKVHVSGALYVELSQGKSCTVEVEPGSASDLVSVEIQNGTLYLKNAPNKKERREKIVVKVCVEDLKELHMSGATSVLSVNQLGVETLNLDADGASNVNLSLKATKLIGDFSGASNVEIAGSCETVKLDVSGASQARLDGLAVRKVNLDNSGAAQVELWISEDLTVEASGASTTTYKVNSVSSKIRVDINTSGSAQVKRE
jgi:hypothetical protein